MSRRSCEQCKYLFTQGDGYSDYTWIDNFLTCALDLNPHLPIEEPWEFDLMRDSVAQLRWLATISIECESFQLNASNIRVVISPDGNVDGPPHDGPHDEQQMRAILGAEKYVAWLRGLYND